MKRQLLLLSLLFLFYTAHAQRGNNWVFGNKVWLNFSTTPISARTSAMVQSEGSSSMSDLNGNLLFYSDGMTIWNAHHSPMPNGTGLFGHVSSTQSSMIVPFPADPNRYYVFTMDVIGGAHGLSYSVVNMNLDNGNGDVEIKNQFLIGPSAEKVTSINHCNGKDIWVITAVNGTDKFYAYLVSASGISTPVISSSGIPNMFSVGYLKLSPDGSKLACASLGVGADLFDFDDATGIISNRKTIVSGTNHQVYGIEFSPNSKILYLTDAVRTPPSACRFDISQYSQLDASAAAIVSTRVELDNFFLPFSPPNFAWFNALQVSADGRIYISVAGSDMLSTILDPDRQGTACTYSPRSFLLASGTTCIFGLPDFNQSYFKGTFRYDASCTSTDVSFFSTRAAKTTSVKWDFDDPSSGPNNNATIDSPVHHYSSPGIYQVTLIAYMACRNDTMKKTIAIGPLAVDLGPDRDICTSANTLVPQTNGNVLSYLWQDNSTAPVYSVTHSGLYWVEVRNSICVKRDSVNIILKPAPVYSLGNDTTICERTALLLDAGNTGASYTWQDNSHNQTYLAKNAGLYHVAIQIGNCILKDSIIIDIKKTPRLYLGNDTAICNGMTVTLTPFLNYATNAAFLWNTGEITPSISVTQPGLYSLSVSNECGTNADGILVRPGVCRLYVPTAFTPNNDGRNDIFKPGYGENVVSYSMEIYDRWGMRVFASKELSKGWDGKYKSVLQPAGVFAWTIRYKVFNDPTEYYMKGTLLLVY